VRIPLILTDGSGIATGLPVIVAGFMDELVTARLGL